MCIYMISSTARVNTTIYKLPRTYYTVHTNAGNNLLVLDKVDNDSTLSFNTHDSSLAPAQRHNWLLPFVMILIKIVYLIEDVGFINQPIPTVCDGTSCVPTKPIQQHTIQWPLPCTSCYKFLERHICQYPMYLFDLPYLTVVNRYGFTTDSYVWLDQACVAAWAP